MLKVQLEKIKQVLKGLPKREREKIKQYLPYNAPILPVGKFYANG